MDNVGDWLYIVFLIIAAVSGLFSSKDKKKKSRPDILGQPDREIVPNDQPTEGKGFWEILEDMQKETQKPKPAPRQKQVTPKVEKPQVVTSSPASSRFSVILCKFAPEILNSKYLPKNIKTNYHGIKIHYS